MCSQVTAEKVSQVAYSTAQKVKQPDVQVL
jgi:hypothetical protein